MRVMGPKLNGTSFIHPSIHVYSQKVDTKCKQNQDNMHDRKVMQDSYNFPKNLN